MKIGLFGGSFNPPHVGHVISAAYASAIEDFAWFWVLPCWHHAFNKDLVDFEHRLQMCRLAFQDHKMVKVPEFERIFKTRYTVDLVERIQEMYPIAKLTLIIGSDNLAVSHKWHRWDDLKKMVDLLVLPRHGSTEESLIFPDVSSTQVRGLLRDRDFKAAGRLVPASVLRYIQKHELYL